MTVATRQPRVSVVVPTYNEKENIREFKRRLEPVLQSMGGRVTVLFVDDNSPDGTGAEIRGLMESTPAFRILEREGKKGLGTAYIEGFRKAIEGQDPEIVVQMDADLQHPPEILESLVERVASGGADVAIASRHVKGGSFKGLNWRRRTISRGASWFSRTVLGLGVKDTTTGFKALKRSAVECLLAHPPRSAGFIFQVESLYIMKKNGFKMVEVPFTFEERAKGASKMGGGEMWEFLVGVLSIRFRRY
ncbi:MAG TPA: polyprenol monophosphomannose synthase [Nitrososphaerales archaeon]|nr:polyprenol monophosphomannose synthase [Nitrososphaerales archaeon]